MTEVLSSAVLSDDGLYRYELTRTWNDKPKGRRLCWVMLNPSTADASQDDPTIRRCIGFSKDWGYNAMVVVNLFGLRSTDPRGLLGEVNPVGPDNDSTIESAVLGSSGVIAAWGTKGSLLERDYAVTALITRYLGRDLLCLDVTKGGHPKHPLYVKGDTVPSTYKVSELQGNIHDY